jgi:hypothetical protein
MTQKDIKAKYVAVLLKNETKWGKEEPLKDKDYIWVLLYIGHL